MYDYPFVRKDESVIDDHFGFKIPDPYRWLEDPDSEETKTFVNSQNALTMPFINSCPYKSQIHEKLLSLWNYEKYDSLFKRGSRYYYFYNTGLQNQSVLYTMEYLGATPKIFFDPNSLCADGLISLRMYSFSEDGEYFAYGLSTSGSDWSEIKIKKVLTGEDLPETLTRIKFSCICWTHDNKGFFYSCYPDAAEDADGHETTTVKNQKLKYHRIGETQLQDVLCLERPDQPTWLIQPEVSHCGRYLFISFHDGCERNNLLYFSDLEHIDYNIVGKLVLTAILDKFECVFDYVTNASEKVIIRTDLDAPMFKLIVVDLANLSRETWKDLIPHDEKVLLEWTVCVNHENLIICRMKDVVNQLSLHSLETGNLIQNLDLPVGTVSAFGGRKKDTMVFFQFTSFLTPGQIYSFDCSQPLMKPKVIFETRFLEFDLSDFTVSQVFYESKDSTRVPMFVVHRKDLKRDGNSPCILYGYGGFAISVKPAFSISKVFFLQYFHGVAAFPNIRGGGEYGEKWHNGGKKALKQNSYDDFIAAAEYLIESNYTSRNILTIEGGSNGGLLVSACCNQRPELFAAALCHVPVTDLLRFALFTIGFAWCSDYGDVNSEEDFHFLLRHSSLHNIRKPSAPDAQYPAILVLTADHDDRVSPLHSFKYVATLQDVIGKRHSPQTNPLFIRIEKNVGHGSGKPTKKLIAELTDAFSFLQASLRIPWKG